METAPDHTNALI